MVGLEHMQRARLAATRYRVDEDQRVPLLEQVIRQVHARDAVVDHADSRIVLWQLGFTDNFGAEPVVAQEDVADPGYQDARCHRISRSGYIRLSLRYRRASGSDITPRAHPIPTTQAMMATNIHPRISMSDSFHLLRCALPAKAQPRRGRSTDSARTIRAGRRRGRRRPPPRRVCCPLRPHAPT